MIAKITPVSLFGFGTADTLLVRSINDDLSSSATFFWQLGKLVMPASLEGSDEIPKPMFIGADHAIGNAALTGDAYTAWTGNNAIVPSLLAPQIGVTVLP